MREESWHPSVGAFYSFYCFCKIILTQSGKIAIIIKQSDKRAVFLVGTAEDVKKRLMILESVDRQ